MVKIKWNEEALTDIDEIASFIAKDSLYYAYIQVENFFERAEILQNGIRVGKIVRELGNSSVREILEGNYRIIYEIVNEESAEILCVLHGKRLLKRHPTFKQKK